MKTIGLIGGLSWFSTTVYYKTINELVTERLGGHHSAKILLYSIDAQDFGLLMSKADFTQADKMFSDIALMLEKAGAHCVAICSNTPHIAAEAVRQKIKIPLVHIAEETAKEIAKQKIKTVALLGTKFTMEHSFFRDKLEEAGIETIIPDKEDRDYIHSSIIDELTKGIFKEETKNKYLSIIDKLKMQNAEGVILGCTEIPILLNKPTDCSIPAFDTTVIHSRALVNFALAAETIHQPA